MPVLKSIEREYGELRDRIRSSEVVITKAVNTVFYTLIIGLLCLGGLIVALLRM